MTRWVAAGLLASSLLPAAGAVADEGEETSAIAALEKLGALASPEDVKGGRRYRVVRFGYKRPVSETDIREAVVHLRKLSDLRLVSLDFTWITDAGLAPLAELPGLSSLTLKATLVTDTGLTHLRKMRGLTSIDLSLTRVTDKGMAELRKALPNAELLRSGAGTPTTETSKLRGAWRGTRILPRHLKKYEQEDSSFAIVAVNDLALDLEAGTFKLNPDSGPKGIDVEFKTCLPGLNTPFGRYLGIYRLEGDTLTLCLSPVYGQRPERPTKFSAEGFDGFMYVFKRMK